MTKIPLYKLSFSLLFALQFLIGHSQSISAQLKSNIETELNQNQISKRNFIAKDSTKWKNFIPTRYVFGALLYCYQNIISEQISANCAYELSCSEFSKKSISKFGILKGILLTSHRLIQCNESAIIDFPDYKKNQQFKISHDFEDY